MYHPKHLHNEFVQKTFLYFLKVYWPNCVVENKKLVGGVDISTEKIPDMESCSTNCYNNSCCQFWNFDSSKFDCTLKQKNDTPVDPATHLLVRDELYVYHGERHCFGRGSIRISIQGSITLPL